MTSVLVLLARRGHAVQETLPVIDTLERAGVNVVLGTEAGGDVRFDPACVALAFGEMAWAPSWRLHRRAKATGRLQQVSRPAGSATSWAHTFDAVVIPGGHGPIYGAFARGPFVNEAIHAFARAGKVVGLICHSVGAGALPGPAGETPLAQGRQVTCWPRAMERTLGSLPFGGKSFVPFGTPAQDLVETVTPFAQCSGLPWRMPHAVVDGPLVTAWGPWSGEAFARALMKRMADA